MANRAYVHVHADRMQRKRGSQKTQNRHDPTGDTGVGAFGGAGLVVIGVPDVPPATVLAPGLEAARVDR
jgi:hypothetical protein